MTPDPPRTDGSGAPTDAAGRAWSESGPFAFLARLTRLGVDPRLPPYATRHIVLTNELALYTTVALAFVTFGPLSHTLLPEVRHWLLASLLMSPMVLVLNRLGLHVLCSSAFIAVYIVSVYSVGRLQPAATMQAVFFPLIAAISWFMFPPGWRVAPAIATVASTAAAVMLMLSWRDEPPPPQLPGYDIEALALGNLIGVVTATVFFCARAAMRIVRVERALVEERAKTESLLKREVAHQVAERSRELGAALSAQLGPLAPPAHATPTRFGSRYRVVRKLGEGAMGAVFEVERLSDMQRLALKVMTGAGSREHAARFAREAEIGARVADPHVVSIVDVGLADSGAPYLVMELVTGGSLAEQRYRFGDVEWALPILRQILRGLAALHAEGVVHRDLKPGNVLLDAHGAAKVTDFGIARMGLTTDLSVTVQGGAVPRAPQYELTATGAWIGTPQYMAPETARGVRQAGTPADIFAFGVLAYELLTGVMPFETPPLFLALAGQPLDEPPPLTSGKLDDEARAVLRSCLAEDPRRRPDMTRLRGALGA